MANGTSQDFVEHLIHDLPATWRLCRLDRVVAFASGLWTGSKPPLRRAKVLRNTNFNNDGTLDFSNIAELDVQVSQFTSRELCFGDIILERSGGGPAQPVGRVVIFEHSEEGFSFSNFTTRLRVLDPGQVYPKYLLYYLLFFYDAGYTNSLQKRTTGIRNLMFADYQGVVIPLPPLPEQRRIAAVLSAIQDAIAAQEDVVTAARTFKRSLMQRLFTYGAGKEPAETKETEIGEIPAHWEVKPLASLVRHKITDGTHKTPLYRATGIPFISVSNLGDGKVDFSTCKFITLGEHQQLVRRCRPEPGDILLSKVGTLGLVALVPQEPEFSIFVQIALIKPNSDILSGYLVHCLSSEPMQQQIHHQSSRSTMEYIGVGKVAELQIPVPPKSEMEQVAASLDAADTKIAAEEDRLTALQALFKSMLHQLMTGQIRLLSDEGLPLQ